MLLLLGGVPLNSSLAVQQQYTDNSTQTPTHAESAGWEHVTYLSSTPAVSTCTQATAAVDPDACDTNCCCCQWNLIRRSICLQRQHLPPLLHLLAAAVPPPAAFACSGSPPPAAFACSGSALPPLLHLLAAAVPFPYCCMLLHPTQPCL
jgi:hypothetical protein